MEQAETIKYSIITPVFNEEGVVEQVLKELNGFLITHLKERFEIIAVDDGSVDKSGAVLARLNLPNLKVLKHLSNKGYGASLKSGARQARGKYLVFFDSDGQHRPADVLNLIKEAARYDYDMVVGSRVGYQGPKWRQPGKKLITALANYLVKAKIPDLNSGLRLIKKQSFEKFTHLLPNSFSLTTTITLSFLKHGFEVKYLPITAKKRVGGKSFLKPTDGLRTILLVLRMIMLFSPLQVFLPIAFLLFIVGVPSLFYDVFVKANINDVSVLLIVSSILIFLFGLLADQIAAARRELKL